MANCEICTLPTTGTSNLCRIHGISYFQIMELLETYIKEDPPPSWLLKGIRQLSWVYRDYPLTAGYFNTAQEITEIFLFDREDKIPLEVLKEVNYTKLPRDRIITLLENAFIIKRDGEKLTEGELIKKLKKVRWEGYQLESIQIENKLLELYGILSVALTKSLLENKEYIPQRALAIFDLFSLLINEGLTNESEEVKSFLENDEIEIAFKKVGKRQSDHMLRQMRGIVDGKTKIISDVADDGKAILKDDVKEYLTIMRNRYRERERERDRSI